MRAKGKTLRAAREKADLTRKALAERAGLSKETVKRLEVDPRASTKYETLVALAGALGLNVDDLAEVQA